MTLLGGSLLGSRFNQNEIDDAVGSVGQDIRPLSKLYAKPINKRKFVWWGDSTTEQMASVNLISYDGAYKVSFINSDLVGSTHFNYGASGRTLASVMVSGTDLNSGGINVKINSLVSFAESNQGACYIICFGINDCRNDASIAGSSYGDAAQIAKANTLRTLLESAYSQIKTADPNAEFVWRMPNSHGNTSTFIENGVTGQNCMDVYQLVYRGDANLGLPAIDEFVGGGLLFDTLRVCYTDTATQDFGLLDADNLHPSVGGYEVLLSNILRLLALNSDDIIKLKDANQALHMQSSLAKTVLHTNTVAELKDNPEVYNVASCKVDNSQPTYLDLSFYKTDISTAMWGGEIGSGYGSASEPALSFGDIIALTKSDGEELIIHINKQADVNNGVYLRWFSGGPDGFYPGTGWIGATGNIYRHKYANSNKARLNDYDLSNVGVGNTFSGSWYLVNILSVADGSLTVQGIAGQRDGFENYTPKTSDTICIIGVDDSRSFSKGISLSPATITAGSNPSEWDISIAGYDFRNAMCRQAVIISG